jgi:hypothetical protein
LLGNERRFLLILRKLMSTGSMALVCLNDLSLFK